MRIISIRASFRSRKPTSRNSERPYSSARPPVRYIPRDEGMLPRRIIFSGRMSELGHSGRSNCLGNLPVRPRIGKRYRRANEEEENMHLQLRDCLLVMMLAAALRRRPRRKRWRPRVGRQPMVASKAPRPSRISRASGTHSIPGFEPLASGPTALVNRSRRPNGTGNILQLVGDYTNPILKPQAAEVVKKHGELALKGIGDPNPRNQCWPSGVPFVFTDRPTQLAANAEQDHHPLWPRSSGPSGALERDSSGAGGSVLVRRFRRPLRRRHAGDRHGGVQDRPVFRDRLVRHAISRRLCMSSNDIGCSITQRRKTGSTATQKSIIRSKGSGPKRLR